MLRQVRYRVSCDSASWQPIKLEYLDNPLSLPNTLDSLLCGFWSCKLITHLTIIQKDTKVTHCCLLKKPITHMHLSGIFVSVFDWSNIALTLCFRQVKMQLGIA